MYRKTAASKNASIRLWLSFFYTLFAFHAFGGTLYAQGLVDRARYVFVTTNGLNLSADPGRVVRFDRLEIANRINDPNAPDPVGVVIRSDFDPEGPEGAALDTDGAT